MEPFKKSRSTMNLFDKFDPHKKTWMSVSSAQPCLSDHDITQPGEVRPFKSGGSRQGKYLQVYRVYLLDTCANLLLDHVATIGFHSYRVGTINGFGDAV